MSIQLTEPHLRFMNIGRVFWDATLQGMNDEQREAIQDYAEDLVLRIQAGLGCLLWGKNSVGKSYILAALCKKVWGQYRVASFCVTAEELKECWIEDREAPEGAESILERARRIRYLFIDDLGKEHRTQSGFAENRFGALLRARSRERKVTSLTTNLNPTEIENIYGTSTLQLATECMIPIRVEGPNMREKIFEKHRQEIRRTR